MRFASDETRTLGCRKASQGFSLAFLVTRYPNLCYIPLAKVFGRFAQLGFELFLVAFPKKTWKLSLSNFEFVAKSRKSAELFACVRLNVRFYLIRVGMGA
ncbi:MAG: hypothetical protein DWI24_07130 [Planctomycetota bacterium]|nr:MAG: hypothetical protein DWI24_07130 [Planctomycetota bacterium]